MCWSTSDSTRVTDSSALITKHIASRIFRRGTNPFCLPIFPGCRPTHLPNPSVMCLDQPHMKILSSIRMTFVDHQFKTKVHLVDQSALIKNVVEWSYWPNGNLVTFPYPPHRLQLQSSFIFPLSPTETDPCADVTCLNGGKTVISGETCSCECPEDRLGDECEGNENKSSPTHWWVTHRSLTSVAKVMIDKWKHEWRSLNHLFASSVTFSLAWCPTTPHVQKKTLAHSCMPMGCLVHTKWCTAQPSGIHKCVIHLCTPMM